MAPFRYSDILPLSIVSLITSRPSCSAVRRVRVPQGGGGAAAEGQRARRAAGIRVCGHRRRKQDHRVRGDLPLPGGEEPAAADGRAARRERTVPRQVQGHVGLRGQNLEVSLWSIV